MCGNRPCGEQFSSVSRKQNEILKCNLLPSEECQVVGGQLPQEAASTKRKSTLPGALSFGQLGQFRLAGTQATHLGKQKEPGTRIASRLSLLANDPNCDTNEPPFALGGSLCAKGVHGFFNCSVPYNPHPMPTWHPELVSGFFLNRLDCTPPVAAPLRTHGD